MRVLAVYNTCQISCQSNTPFYLKAIAHLALQPNVQICISGCMMNDDAKRTLHDNFPFCSFVWVDEVLPLNVTVNNAVLRMRERHGDFTHYLYLDSGMDVGPGDCLGQFFSCFSCATTIDYQGNVAPRGDVACAASVVDDDSGYEWLGILPPGWPPDPHWVASSLMASGHCVRLPPGKTVNMHAQVYTHEFLERYGRLLPDIFASDCSEQVTPYLCAAIGKQFVLAPPLIRHEGHMDGGSSGFQRGSGHDCKLFRCPKTLEQLCAEGKQVGWGFEEWCNVLRHDPAKFDANGYARDDELFRWLKANVFLQDFDYGAIKHEVI
jgi:hypothetical protein